MMRWTARKPFRMRRTRVLGRRYWRIECGTCGSKSAWTHTPHKTTRWVHDHGDISPGCFEIEENAQPRPPDDCCRDEED